MTNPMIEKLAGFCAAGLLFVVLAAPAAAEPFFFSTGNPDGQIGMATRPSSSGKIETEAADDFVLTQTTSINHLTFTGLVPDEANVVGVTVEIYRVFPKDSTVPPSGNVPTRTNSPSDVAFASKSDAANELFFSTITLAPNFTANNSVLNGINKLPGQTTGGEGSVTAPEVTFSVDLTTPFVLPADHYFFVPQVELTGGEFYWLSAPKPIVAPGTPFAPDLQAWMRNENLDPDWLRVGTDIIGGNTTFNAAFTLSGTVVPEPSAWAQMLIALACLGAMGWRRR
jgi:hypothetical protein